MHNIEYYAVSYLWPIGRNHFGISRKGQSDQAQRNTHEQDSGLKKKKQKEPKMGCVVETNQN